jgi:uncharacterized protein (DUF736 family)
MIMGRFQKEGSGFFGSIDTLTIQLNPVRLKYRNKGADYAVLGPDEGELGAAWRKSGEFGDYLSVKLDCPSLIAPINATMTLKEAGDGFYLLRWQRRGEGRGRGRDGANQDRP